VPAYLPREATDGRCPARIRGRDGACENKRLVRARDDKRTSPAMIRERHGRCPARIKEARTCPATTKKKKARARLPAIMRGTYVPKGRARAGLPVRDVKYVSHVGGHVHYLATYLPKARRPIGSEEGARTRNPYTEREREEAPPWKRGRWQQEGGGCEARRDEKEAPAPVVLVAIVRTSLPALEFRGKSARTSSTHLRARDRKPFARGGRRRSREILRRRGREILFTI